MGAIGYAAQSGLYFGALERMDASLLALILYVYPASVLLGAVALGRERATPRRIAALVVALAGIALVLGGAASGALDPLGAVDGPRRRRSPTRSTSSSATASRCRRSRSPRSSAAGRR